MIVELLPYMAFAFFSYFMGLAIYRAYLSPLSKVPGSKLAAMSQCYEMYYDLIQPARFPWHIKKLHEIYGMLL